MLSLKEIKSLLREKQLHLSKKMGQNFLIDKNIRDKILAAADIQRGDSVVEIGPGLGALTEGLLERGAQVRAVEKDRGLCRVLRERIASPDLELICEDALKLDWDEWLSGEGKNKLVANLPYNITTPLLFRLLDCSKLFSRMVIMVQQEVGERFSASPTSKQYGALTLKIKYHASVEKLFTVSPGSFFPRPEVSSLVLEMIPRVSPPVKVSDEELLFAIINTGFGQRRKTLANNLKRRGWTARQIKKVFACCGLEERVRAEELELDDFSCLANGFSEQKEGGLCE